MSHMYRDNLLIFSNCLLKREFSFVIFMLKNGLEKDFACCLLVKIIFSAFQQVFPSFKVIDMNTLVES